MKIDLDNHWLQYMIVQTFRLSLTPLTVFVAVMAMHCVAVFITVW